MLHFSEVFPLPLRDRFDYVKLLESAKLPICIENNASGQFSRLVHSETGFEFITHIRKFDGRPFTVEELKGEINGHLGRL
jgi:2-oxoglutarate ferredoxin oxidoreductase subunit alpha